MHIFRNLPFAFEASVEDETENKSGVELQNTAMGKKFLGVKMDNLKD